MSLSAKILFFSFRYEVFDFDPVFIISIPNHAKIVFLFYHLVDSVLVDSNLVRALQTSLVSSLSKA
jgi:hypothetical protein